MTLTQNQRATIIAAVGLTACVGVSLSLFIPLLSLEMERQGYSATYSGLSTAVGGLGTLAAVPFVPRLAARFGVFRLLSVAIVANSVLALGFYALPVPAWFGLRFVFGAVLGTIFVLSEYWINAAAPPERRGLIMGIYATVLSGGFAAGPLILLLTGTAGIAPYLAGAILSLAALAPLLAARSHPPALEEKEGTRVLPFLVSVPIATCAALVFGAIETGGFALFPVYGLRSGLSENSAAVLVSVVAAGNVVSQIPIGWLADRMDRRLLLLVLAASGTVGCLLMPLTIEQRWVFYALLFVWGGLTGGLYTVGLAYLGQRFSGHDLAAANAAFVMLYSIGLIGGPPLVGIGMDLAGAKGFAYSLSGMLAAYALLIVVKMRRAPTSKD